jgi:hypothetical protein
MTAEVISLFPPELRDDPVGFLRALADDIESGDTPNYKRAVLMVQGEDGGFRLWSFGPGINGSYETLGILQIGTTLVTDQILEVENG